MSITYVRRVGGDDVEVEDTKDTFSAGNVDLQPASGDVWNISVVMRVTGGGGIGDDVYIYFRTDDGSDITLDFEENSATAEAHIHNVLISNDCYIRLTHAGAGTCTYWYQAFKVS